MKYMDTIVNNDGIEYNIYHLEKDGVHTYYCMDYNEDTIKTTLEMGYAVVNEMRTNGDDVKAFVISELEPKLNT